MVPKHKLIERERESKSKRVNQENQFCARWHFWPGVDPSLWEFYQLLQEPKTSSSATLRSLAPQSRAAATSRPRPNRPPPRHRQSFRSDSSPPSLSTAPEPSSEPTAGEAAGSGSAHSGTSCCSSQPERALSPAASGSSESWRLTASGTEPVRLGSSGTGYRFPATPRGFPSSLISVTC